MTIEGFIFGPVTDSMMTDDHVNPASSSSNVVTGPIENLKHQDDGWKRKALQRPGSETRFGEISPLRHFGHFESVHVVFGKLLNLL